MYGYKIDLYPVRYGLQLQQIQLQQEHDVLSSHMPDLAALEMLNTVQRLGSFSAAGKELGLSQQAISSRMRMLERLLGAPLFARSPRGATLTATGALVADWADDLLAVAEKLDAGITSLRSDTASHLHVVASQTIAEHLIPGWLVALRDQEIHLNRKPTVVELTVSNSKVAAEMVRTGRAVVGFIETPLLPKGLACSTVHHDEMVLVAASDHVWASRKRPVEAAELAATPLVKREVGSGTRDALDSMLDEQELEGQEFEGQELEGQELEGQEVVSAPPAVELSTTASVRSAIAAGLAPGVLSSLAVRDDLELGRLVAIPTHGLDVERPLTAIWHSGKAPPAGPARDLVALARSYVGR